MRTHIFTRRNAENAILLLVILLILASASALRTVAQSRQLSLADILIALRSKKAEIGEKNKILADAVKQRGITFSLTPEIEKELGSTGAAGDLLVAIRDKAPTIKNELSPSTVSTTTQVQPNVVKVAPPPPPDFAFYRSRANSAISNNDLDAAMAALDKAGELRPADASVFVDRGSIFLKKGNLANASEQFTKAIEIDPKSFAAYFGRAMVREKLGRSDDALADLQKAVEIDPANEPSSAAVARLKAAQVAKAEAERVVADAAKPKAPSSISVGNIKAYATKLTLPLYPAFEKRMGIEGKVSVLVKLDAAGNVTSAEAIDGPKSLRKAAEDAIKASKFKPVMVNGTAIPSSGVIVFNFSL
ncbi:MAG TPA: TonB family protein [Pyrinomonadaceae bacterium]|nr:TonB family protein [Pyrinomonadaceae bacterium]